MHIEAVRHKDYAYELTRLFNDVFGVNISQRTWSWKYLDNPLADPEPEIVVAIDNGRIVGARPLLRVNLLYHNNRLRCVVPCDTMVHKDYRRQGIFSQMNEVALNIEEKHGTALVFNFPNRISGAGYLKQGWREVTFLEDYVRLLRPSRVGHAITGNAVLSSILGVGYSAFCGWRGTDVEATMHGVDIAVYGRWPSVLRQVDAAYDSLRLELERSEEFMRWRLDSNPLERNLYIVASQGSTLLGFAVLAIGERFGNLMQGLVADIVICEQHPRLIHTLIATVLKTAADNGCDYVRAWPNKSAGLSKGVLSGFGFLTVMSRLNRRVSPDRLPRLVIKKLNPFLLFGSNVRAVEGWNVTPLFRDPT